MQYGFEEFTEVDKKDQKIARRDYFGVIQVYKPDLHQIGDFGANQGYKPDLHQKGDFGANQGYKPFTPERWLWCKSGL